MMISVGGMVRSMKERIMGDGGAGFAEYALILFLVAIAAVGALTTFGETITGIFDEGTGLPDLTGDPAGP
jgi:Flp pilus assembly pilin Flp